MDNTLRFVQEDDIGYSLADWTHSRSGLHARCLTGYLAIAFLIWVTITLAACQPPRREHYSPAEFVGTWQAKYVSPSGGPIHSNYGTVTVAGTETFTFRPDGTYQQVFEDGKGYVYVSSWNRWYLKDLRDADIAQWRPPDRRTPTTDPRTVGAPGYTIIYLEGGRYYLEGIEEVERRASNSNGKRPYGLFEGTVSISMSVTDSAVYPRSRSSVKGGIVLKSLEVGDPDDPDSVTYYLIDAPTPTATPTP